MLGTTHDLIKRAGKQLDLDDQQIGELIKNDAEHIFEIGLSNGKKFKAYRIQHSSKLGPYKGGIRFHSRVNLGEMRALALLMTLKSAAVGLPLGGAKGGVVVDPKELTEQELEELSRKYVKHLCSYIGPDKDISAPDVNTNAKIIDWMVAEYEKLTRDSSHASFTGKSLKNDGSLGREAATGRGGVIALRELLMLQGLSLQHKLSYGVQGYGNVGSYFARIAQVEQPNWKLIVASDSKATVYKPEGLNAEELAKFKKNGGSFSDYKGAKVLGPEEIIGQGVDVLILAALEGAITEKNVKQVKAKYIIEMANGPINAAAYDCLTRSTRSTDAQGRPEGTRRATGSGQASQPIRHSSGLMLSEATPSRMHQGVVILPDIVANAGGVVVSYLEWVQNKNNAHWDETRVNAELERYLVKAVDRLCKIAKEENVSLKEAAFILALKRLTK